MTQSAVAPERGRLQQMIETLHHRGPDDGGVWFEHAHAHTVGLGHRRLSIIDLSAAGHQPMTNEDASIWLTYNGEIYNHEEVRKELLARGHQYKSRTDSETILHAYEEWGDACIERFRGMFAFAIWDTCRSRLLLVRDRLGVKPLYYATRPGVIAFGSEIKAILASGLFETQPAQDAIPEYLMFGYLAGDGTLFEGVRKLPPGHLLVWENDRAVVRQYWDVAFRPDESSSEDELADRLRQLFETSVRDRLMSDVPLGVFLSGGLDSSAIAAVAARQISGRLRTFSVGFEREYYSELPFARAVARHIGADHHEVILTADDFLADLPRLVWHEDEPLWSAPSVALFKVSELASQSVKVVLTGEGSDELFAGYDRYWMTSWNVRLLNIYRTMPAALRSAVRGSLVNGPLPERARRALSHTFINHQSVPDGLVFDNWFGIFTPEMQRRYLAASMQRMLAAADVRASHRQFFERGNVPDVIDRMLYTDIKTNLVELLMKQDQMSMATSIESRVPFLDHRLVELAATIPSRYKIGKRSGKHIVKRALSAYLPGEILHRPKKGFPVPFDSWLKEKFLGQIGELLLAPAARSRGWFDTGAVRELIDAHRTGRQNHARQIWNLWGLELWARIFLDGDRSSIQPRNLPMPRARTASLSR